MIAKDKPLYSKVLVEDKRQYTIPVYQRAYTWEKKQCKQLFDDILLCIKYNKRHYLGSLVYKPSKHGDFTTCQIIDGQQRITTVMLLLKAIYDLISNDKDSTKEKIYKALYNSGDDFIEGLENRLKLQTINDDDSELKKILAGNSKTINKLSNVAKNYFYFKGRIIEATKAGYNLATIFKGIKKLDVVEIKLDDSDRPQIIFESINATGKSLNDDEKIRNFILMGITNKTDQNKYFKEYWEPLAETLKVKNTKNDFVQAFFYHYLIMKKGAHINAEELYDAFKEYYYSVKDNKSLGEDLLKYAEYYKLLVCNNSNLYSEKTNSLAKVFGEIRHNTIYPFLMRVCDDYSDIQKLYNEEISLDKKAKNQLLKRETEFQQILEFLINYAIRRNICEIPSSSLTRFYASLYNNIFEIPENKAKYLKAIQAYLCLIDSEDIFPSDSKFKKHLMEVNLYKRSKILKMFFELIEDKGDEKLNWSNLTTEHILPQHPNYEWELELGDRLEEIKDTYLNTLGNLSKTGYNSEYQNRGFAIKKAALEAKAKDNTLKVYTLNEELLDPDVTIWDDVIIQKRANRLANIIVANYPYPTRIDKTIKFNIYNQVYIDETENRFIITDDSKLFGFRLFNDDVKCKNPTDLYIKLLNRLYALNPNILDQLAEDNWKPWDGKRAYISTDKEDLYYSRKLDDNIDIFIDTNTSTEDKYELIVKLIDIYHNELNRNDFCLLYENDYSD